MSNLDLKFTHGERVLRSSRMELVLPMCVIQGRADLTPQHLFFFPEGFEAGHEGSRKDMRVRKWELNAIVDALALYALYDDGPLRCEHHYCSLQDDRDATTVLLVPQDAFTGNIHIMRMDRGGFRR